MSNETEAAKPAAPLNTGVVPVSAGGPTPVAEKPAEAEPRISITDFCRAQSHADKRVELLKGFYHYETVGKRTYDTRTNYAARYAAFINLPA